jgi:hypothetical protein
LQRLFSTFADGWPGIGLLFQRVLIGTALLHYGIVHLRQVPPCAPAAPDMIGAAVGILLLLGLWTPVVGILVAVVQMWIILSRCADPWIPSMLAILGATLAMIGPGAWSIDARLFGRKHIETV